MDHIEENYAQYLEANPLSGSLYNYYLSEEGRCIRMLIRDATPSDEQKDDIKSIASRLITAARDKPERGVSVDSFLKEFSLDTGEGISLMCLAEALIRVPDHETAQAFIKDRLKDGQWNGHLGHSGSFWINASTWGLLLNGKLFNHTPEQNAGSLSQMLHRLGAPLVLRAVQQALNLIGEQFVCGQTIEQANKVMQQTRKYRYSFDMLGEAAMTPEDAGKYTQGYRDAIEFLAKHYTETTDNIIERPGISIKLSALHCRYEPLKRSALKTLRTTLLDLTVQAKEANIPVTIDAEECYRLEPSLEIFADLFKEDVFKEWPYLGLAIQAYQKRANPQLQWLKGLALKYQRRIPIRLVKGAYWDYEIKRAQIEGLSNYPVFTKKHHTDISYLTCAQYILKHPELFYGQFGTHNAHSIASIYVYAKAAKNTEFEFQRLHGMGESLYNELIKLYPEVPCRVYAPVGKHKELLPYLVRRLLENGANSSFIRSLNNDETKMEALVAEPSGLTFEDKAHKGANIALPVDIYQTERVNSIGVNFHNAHDLKECLAAMQPHIKNQYFGKDQDLTIRNPADRRHILGSRHLRSSQECQEAISTAQTYFPVWRSTSADTRAVCLERLADLIDHHRYHLMALLMTEAGKTLWNAQDEIREAIDFCRYYASQAREHFSLPRKLAGPTGEENELYWEGRGVFLCISPWNFPLAILLGQVSAALAAGNCVIAKPATDSELIARQVIELIHEAGVPAEACQFIPCSARIFGTNLLSDHRVCGVAFTGSIATARQINIQLAQRNAGIATTVMETGGQNALIVDSTALPEQVVQDVIRSAFDSAGQRCSALRVLFLQEEIAPRVLELLIGRMGTIKVGNPLDLETDIGPVINENAKNKLLAHLEEIPKIGRVIASTAIDPEVDQAGYYIPPTLVEIDRMCDLKEEVFGPILHVIRFKGDAWDDIVEQINSTHYGLTLGIHSRIESRAHDLARRVRVGNVYVNRDIIGARVGSQPFGGQGLSGTGPKAGGPNYVTRFATEKTITNNMTAMGGNLRLLSGRH